MPTDVIGPNICVESEIQITYLLCHCSGHMVRFRMGALPLIWGPKPPGPDNEKSAQCTTCALYFVNYKEYRYHLRVLIPANTNGFCGIPACPGVCVCTCIPCVSVRASSVCACACACLQYPEELKHKSCLCHPLWEHSYISIVTQVISQVFNTKNQGLKEFQQWSSIFYCFVFIIFDSEVTFDVFTMRKSSSEHDNAKGR